MAKQYLLSVTDENFNRVATLFPEVQLIEVQGMDIKDSPNKVLVNPAPPPPEPIPEPEVINV